MTIDLDFVYSKVAAGSWAALMQTTITRPRVTAPPVLLALRKEVISVSETGVLAGVVTVSSDLHLYQAASVTAASRNDCATSAKITRITPDTPNDLKNYNARTTMVFAQSDQLTPALQPLDYPLTAR